MEDISSKNWIILVADDVTLNRIILKLYLENSTFPTAFACDGVETMSFIRENAGKSIILLLDIMMPNMNGYEVINEINIDKSLYDRVKIIVISSIWKSEFIDSGYMDKISYFINKPVERTLLLDKISEICV